MNGNSTKKEFPFVFDIYRMLLKPGIFNDTQHYMKFYFDHKKPCSRQTQDSNAIFTKTLELDFTFDVEIEVNTNTEASELEHALSDEKVVFEHKYKIENKGDSPTNKNESFSLFVPDVVQGMKVRFDENQVVCNENVPRISDSNPSIQKKESIEISCDTVKCHRYDCTVKAGLVKQDPVGIAIRMMVNPEQDTSGLLKSERFEIVTKLEMNGQVVASSKSKFEKNEIGKLEAILEWWPIILGVAIAAPVCGACIYGLFKSGVLQKLRVFNNKME